MGSNPAVPTKFMFYTVRQSPKTRKLSSLAGFLLFNTAIKEANPYKIAVKKGMLEILGWGAKLSREELGKRALKSFHPSLFNTLIPYPVVQESCLPQKKCIKNCLTMCSKIG